MIKTILRLLRGEQIFKQTIVPGRYKVGTVIATRIGGGEKALVRVTAITQSSDSLYAVWGTRIDDLETKNSDSPLAG